MKKILAIIMMMLFAGCVQPVWQTKKPVMCPPPPGPTQEQVLEEAKEEQEIEIFSEWWDTEAKMFQMYLSDLLKAPLVIDTIDIDFLDDYQIAILHIRFISSILPANGEAYIIVTRPEGAWNIHGLVAKDPKHYKISPAAPPEDDTRLEAKEQNEHKL